MNGQTLCTPACPAVQGGRHPLLRDTGTAEPRKTSRGVGTIQALMENVMNNPVTVHDVPLGLCCFRFRTRPNHSVPNPLAPFSPAETVAAPSPLLPLLPAETVA